METLEQVLERLKANSQKLELLMKKVMLLAGDMKSEELEKMKKEIDEEQDRILAAMRKFRDEAAKKLQ